MLVFTMNIKSNAVDYLLKKSLLRPGLIIMYMYNPRTILQISPWAVHINNHKQRKKDAEIHNYKLQKRN